jgi:hypothetical protein
VNLVNTSSSGQTISVAFRTSDGTVTQNSLSNVHANGHLSFPLSQQFPALSGQSGLAEFYNAGGTFSLIAQRTDSSGAVVDSPAYSQTGSPILVTGSSGGSSSGSSGGGSLPSFSTIQVTGTFKPDGQPSYQMSITIFPLLASVQSSGVYVLPGYTVAGFNAVFSTVTLSGQTFTFSGFSPGNGGLMLDTKEMMYGVTSASLNITLSPQTVATTGTVTGSLNLVSSLATLNGPLTGTFILR